MNDMSKNENVDIQIYNFAYLDENTKRMISRALLKALCIPGYQVPFSSREMPMPYGWGTGGIQVTSACLIPNDVLKVIDQGADDTTNAVSIRKFFQKTANVAVTEKTSDASLIQTRHRIPETKLKEQQILVYQVPIPEPLRFLEPRETETRKMHALSEYGLMFVKLYEDIIKYLQGQGDLAYNIDPPKIGDTTLYNGEEAASEFIELAQDTWSLIANEAYQSTIDDPPGTFSSEELRQMVEDADLEHISVYYDEDGMDNWIWEGNLSVQLNEPPFDQLRYEVENVDGSKELTDDFEEAYGAYSDREMVRDLIQSAFDSAGMYIDEVQDGSDYEFYLRMTPDYDEAPTEGLEGFGEFLNRMKRYDQHYEEAIEKTFNDLVDDGVAIDPRNALEDEGAGGRGNIKEILTNLKHMEYDVGAGKLNLYGTSVFEIPNMMRNFKEMQKFFPQDQLEMVNINT